MNIPVLLLLLRPVLLVLVFWTVHNEDVTDRAQIFTEAYPYEYALKQSKLRGTWSDSDSNNADSRLDDFVDLDHSIDDYQNVFCQMGTECYVDHVGIDMSSVHHSKTEFSHVIVTSNFFLALASSFHFLLLWIAAHEARKTGVIVFNEYVQSVFLARSSEIFCFRPMKKC